MFARLCITLSIAALVQLAAAATADQAGVYVGTISGKSYVPNDPKGAPWKGPARLQLNVDNSYVLQLPDVEVSSSFNTFIGTANAVTFFNSSGYHANTSLHFKNGTVKGTILFATEDGTSFTQSIEGKLSLKKQSM